MPSVCLKEGGGQGMSNDWCIIGASLVSGSSIKSGFFLQQIFHSENEDVNFNPHKRFITEGNYFIKYPTGIAI